MERGADARPSTRTSTACAGRASFTVDGARRLAASASRPGSTRSRPGATSCARKLEAGQEDLAGELSEGVPLLRDAAARAKGADRTTARALLARRRDRRRRRRRRAAGATSSPPRVERNGERPRQVAEPAADARGRPRPRALRRVVRALPALVGRPRRRAARSVPRPRRARLRRPLPAADPPDRRHEPQGPQQHARRRARRPRQPVGDRRRARAGTTPSTRSSAPRRTFAALSPPRAGTASTSRWTSRSSARPTTRG